MITAGVRDVVDGPSLRLDSDHLPQFTTIALGITGAVVPPYLTAFLVRLPGGAQPLLLLPIVLVPLAAAIAWLRVRRARVELGADGLHEQRVLHLDRFTPRAEMASMVVLRMIESRTLRAPRQLFLRDAAGHTLFRMRESNWGEAPLDALRGRIAVPATTVDLPLTVMEVRAQQLVELAWWERSPILRGVVLAVAMLVGATLLLYPLMPH